MTDSFEKGKNFVPYSVLSEEQAKLIQRNESEMRMMQGGQMITIDGWRVYCSENRPGRVSITAPPKETPYKIRFMREISHKMKQRVFCYTVRIDQRYYILWQSQEPYCVLSIQYEDKRLEEKKWCWNRYEIESLLCKMQLWNRKRSA